MPISSQRPFAAEASAVLLTAILLLEAASHFGLVEGPASKLSPPIASAIRVVVLVASIIGIYGLIRCVRSAAAFATLPPILEAVLGGRSAITTLNTSPLDEASTIQYVIFIILGVITCISIFRSVPRNSPGHGLDTSRRGETYAVEVENVTKKYFLGPVVVSALNGVTLKVRSGEFVAIMGPSGSGKSTLLNLIGALDRPTAGRVLIDGVDISKLNDEELAKLRCEKIGFVFQAYNLIARSSVLRNMELPALVKGYSKEERLRRACNLLSIVGLDGKADRKPKTLSGGEQQRVAIARALINDPQIVLADEPTGNIDSKAGREIIEYLRKMNVEKDVTVITVTHDREVAEMTDRILHLRDGRIIKDEVLGG